MSLSLIILSISVPSLMVLVVGVMKRRGFFILIGLAGLAFSAFLIWMLGEALSAM